MNINKKTRVLCISAILLVVLFATSVYGLSVPTLAYDDDLANQAIFYYTFNRTTDNSTHSFELVNESYDANVTEASLNNFAVINSSRYFDGVDDFIQTPNIFNCTQYTLSFWLNATTIDGVERFLIATTGSEGLSVRTILTGSKQVRFRQWDGGANQDKLITIPENKYINFVVTYDGVGIRIYQDHIITHVKNITCGSSANTQIDFSQGTNDYRGMLDEVYYSGTALNQTLVSELYYRTTNGSVGGIYPFDSDPAAPPVPPSANLTVTLNTPLNNSVQQNLTANYTVTLVELNATNCSLWHNGTGTWHLNQTQFLVPNGTWSNFTPIDLNQGFYSWNVQCFNTTPSNDWGDDNYTFTIDLTNPTIVWNTPDSNNLSEFYDTVDFNIDTSDNNQLWAAFTNITFWNGTIVDTRAFNLSGNSSYNINFSLNLPFEGNYTFRTDLADAHTDQDWKPNKETVNKDKNNKKLEYIFDDATVEIKLTGGTGKNLFLGVDTKRLKDRYTWEFDYDYGAEWEYSYVYTVISDKPLKYIPDSRYTGHFVIWNGFGKENYWLDFLTEQEENDLLTRPVEVVKKNDYVYEVTFYSFHVGKMKFKSLGGLNQRTESVIFNYDNDTYLFGNSYATPVFETASVNHSSNITWNPVRYNYFEIDLWYNNTLYNVYGAVDNVTPPTNMSGVNTTTVIVPLIDVNNTNISFYYTLSGYGSLTPNPANRSLHINTTFQNQTAFQAYNPIAITTNLSITGGNDLTAYVNNTNLGDASLSLLLQFNNTNHSTEEFNNISGFISFINTSMPTAIVASNLNQTIIGFLNVTFNNVSSFRTINETVLLLFFGIDECTNISTLALAMPIFDEVTDDNLNATLETSFNITTGGGLVRGFNYSETKTNHTFCISPPTETFTLDALHRYYATGYDVRGYNMIDFAVNNQTRIVDLFLVNTSLATNVVITVTDENGLPVEDVNIVVNKYNADTGVFLTAESLLTDYNGQTISRIILFDFWYSFTLIQNGTIVDVVGYSNPTPRSLVVTSSLNFQIADTEDIFETFTGLNELAGTFTYNNATNFLRFDYVDTNNIVNTANIKLYSKNANDAVATLVNTTTSTASVDTILMQYTDNESDGLTWTAVAEIKYNDNGSTQIVDTRKFVHDDMVNHLGLDGVFFALILIIVFATIGYFSPTISILMTLVGLTVSVLVGFVYVSVGLLVSLFIAAFFLMWRMKS